MQADGTRVFVKYSKDKLFAENRSNWRFSEKDFLEDDSPAYSGKQRVSGDRRIFSSKRSFLLRKRMMEVSPNHLLLHIESNSLSDSCIRFWNRRISRCRQCPHAGIICSQIVLWNVRMWLILKNSDIWRALMHPKLFNVARKCFSFYYFLTKCSWTED